MGVEFAEIITLKNFKHPAFYSPITSKIDAYSSSKAFIGFSFPLRILITYSYFSSPIFYLKKLSNKAGLFAEAGISWLNK